LVGRRKTNANEILTIPVTCCAGLDRSVPLFSLPFSLFLVFLSRMIVHSFISCFTLYAPFLPFYSPRLSSFFFYFVPHKNPFLHEDVHARSFFTSKRNIVSGAACVQMTCQIVITPRFKRLYTLRLALTETWFWHFVTVELAQLHEQDPGSSNHVTWTDARSCLLAVTR